MSQTLEEFEKNFQETLEIANEYNNNLQNKKNNTIFLK